jgi:hypothetical protein
VKGDKMSTASGILRIRQPDGSIIEVPVGMAANGKSAYEYAKDGGYTGTEAEFAAKLAAPFTTPQMYGAKADGVTDDTAAIQAALDKGGIIYFPAGRYKVTSLLIASKSCRIEMFKQYPNCWQSGDTGDYPQTDADNWMGARIETYSPNGGLTIGASAEVDGLYMRAMTGFSGILLKFDESVGLSNYPGTVRLSHIRLDVDNHSTIPEVMFDFIPKGSYRYFLDDINIGRRHIEFCEYGFRADLSQVSDDNWANDVFIRGLCIDTFADYPLYVNGASRAAGWQFDGLTIQAYPYESVISNGYGGGRTGHTDIVTLKNLQETAFISCYLWDLYKANYSNIFVTENVTNTSCIGCSSEFDEIESALAKQLAYPKNFTVKNLGVDAVVDSETNDTQLTLSDAAGNIKRVTIPGAALSEEQVNAGVENWMNDNAVPREVVGRNKVDVTSEDFITGKLVDDVGDLVTNANMAVTNYIEASYKDIIRMSLAGAAVSGYSMSCYDADKNWIADYNIRSGNSHGIAPYAIEVLKDGTAYVRISMTSNTCGNFSTLESNQFCITVNNSDISYEPYGSTLEGGLAEFIVLQSPNETKYTPAVTDSGLLIAEPVDGGESIVPISVESDPTVPAWAKAATKPSYTKSEVGLGNVLNVRQYSENNPPPYPVTSVNGKKGAVVLTMENLGLQYEVWTFTLEDGSTVTKNIITSAGNSMPT